MPAMQGLVLMHLRSCLQSVYRVALSTRLVHGLEAVAGEYPAAQKADLQS